MNAYHFKAILFCIAGLCAATFANAQVIKNNQVVMGVVDSVHSKILNENRKVWVYVPASYNAPNHAAMHYPVVYLLDGDLHFPSVTGMIQQLSEANSNTVIPEMIVVAIPGPNRNRDLTPSKSATVPASGGGENFTSFIQKELMPHIDSIYPTAPYKILIGHSLGGLLAVNTLVNHPEMFNAYVAIDPSMWWDNAKLLNQARDVFKQRSYAGKWLYLGVANTLPEGLDTLQVRKDTTQSTAHIRAILTMKDMLHIDTAADHLKFAYKYYKDDSHITVPLIAEYDALHFLFNYYSFPIDRIKIAAQKDSKIDFAAEIEAHYKNTSKQLGYRFLPPIDQVNLFGYLSMKTRPSLAFALFSLNLKNYPDSFRANDSMGDYYTAINDKAKATEYFKKALSIAETPATRVKLNKILAEK